MVYKKFFDARHGWFVNSIGSLAAVGLFVLKARFRNQVYLVTRLVGWDRFVVA